jgi:hypothetical protein
VGQQKNIYQNMSDSLHLLLKAIRNAAILNPMVPIVPISILIIDKKERDETVSFDDGVIGLGRFYN